MASPQFPWDLLKAECLRLVCTQLVQASEEGGSYQGASRKDDMVEFLRDVEERGLEPAVKKLEQIQIPRKTATTQAQTSPKRKSSRLEGNEEENEGPNYNTRYKGSKRVKLTQEDREPASTSKTTTPQKAGRPKKSAQPASEKETLSAQKRGRPRKSTEPASTSSATAKRGRGRPRKSGASEANDGSAPAKKGRRKPEKSAAAVEDEDEDTVGDEEKEEEGEGQREKPKRGRGRPRKNAEGAPAPKAPVSRGKQVFAGVVLESRKALLLQANTTSGDADADGKVGPSGAAAGGSEGADGEEEIAVAAAVDLNGFVSGEAASAADSSNKENDPNDMVFINVNETVTHADADADAEGDDDVVL